MTYPPQQPGQPGPYGPRPGQYGQYPQQPYGQPGGPPPRKSRTGLVVAIVLLAVLVLGGGGVAVYLLTRDDSTGEGATQDPTSTKRNETQEDTSADTPTKSGGADAGGAKEVGEQYVEAVNNRDEATAKGLTCTGRTSGPLYETFAGKYDLAVTGERATSDVLVYLTVRVQAQSATTDLQLPVRLTDGKWCLSG